MAHLALADSVDAAEALLDAVGIPGQVVIHHEMRPLQVDPLARGVGRDQNANVRVLQERFLGISPLLAREAAVDDDYRLGPADEVGDPLPEVVQCIPVLREDDQLTYLVVGVEDLAAVLEQSSAALSHFLSVPALRTPPASR